MKYVRWLIKNETVFLIAAICAAISAVFVPPSKDYLNYINWPVLALLFCLMAVVAGFKSTGVFEWLSHALLSKTNHVKRIGMLLVLLCFFLSMLVTNDVALITFVPLTISLLGSKNEKQLIFIIVMETVAANLGSLVTPIGNPQNLFLYSAYDINIIEFFQITLPLGTISLALIILIMLCMRDAALESPAARSIIKMDKNKVIIYLALFIVCLLTVLKLISNFICVLIVLIVIFPTDKRVLLRVDYMLLLTFGCFFVFVGNMQKITIIRNFISEILTGHEILASALVSQVISNVPAAIMLSSFTENAKALVIGTNIGGLGTLVASLASLISYKQYCSVIRANKFRYLAIFSGINFSLLAILLIIEYSVLL